MKIFMLALMLMSLTAMAERETPDVNDFMICTTLAGEADNNNEVNCVKSTNMHQAQAELRARGIQKREMEKLYPKKLYPREHATSFLPQE